MYLKESDFNVGVVNDPETFSQAMRSNKSKLWFNAMKDEINSMASNGVWDLVGLPNGRRLLAVNGSLRPKRTH